ncbi:MAG: hypothetical protein HY791_39840 [Deltaproteobacteria bacterium]|nr:hypothetical protein [Deltaproteobacteria bacterium]
MSMKRGTLLLVAGLLVGPACAEDRTPGSTNTKKDAGSETDTGPVTPVDGGTPSDTGNQTPVDSGVPTDSGVSQGSCDSSDGSGCAGGQVCIFDLATGPTCVTGATTTKQPSEACTTTANECAAGSSCFAPSGTNGVCFKICDIGGNECATLQDQNGNPLVCNQDVLNPASGYGVCAPNLADCTAYSDMCPQGQYCELVSASGETGCVPVAATAAALGAACQPGGCQRGGLCLNLGGGAICQKPCDSVNGTGCGGTEACTPVQTQSGPLPFGVCQASATCTPLADTCPANQMCAPISQTAFGCVAAGTRMPGETCGAAAGQCARGNLCAGSQAGQTVCYKACDANTTCPANTTCNMNAIPNASFGLCL